MVRLGLGLVFVTLVAVALPACSSDASSGGSTAAAGGGAGAGGVSGSATSGSAGAVTAGGSASNSGGTDAGSSGTATGGGGIGGSVGSGGGSGSDPGGGGGGGAGGTSGGGAGGMPAVQPTLKVMTFNLRYGTAPDGDNAWELRRPLTYDVFKKQDADVVGIQEGLDQQLKDIEAAVPGYTRIGVGRDDGKTKGEWSAIYYRSSRFSVESSGTFWFSDTPEVVGSKTWGNDLPRICTWAHLVEKATGYGFYQFNVHLDAYVQVAREKSVVLLMQRVMARPVATDPAFVTGDFNAEEASTANQYMRGAATIDGSANPLPLADSFRVLHPNDTEAGTFHGFKGGTDGAKIDYIYLMPGEKTLAAEIDHSHDGARYPSDHYPVTATIQLPVKP